MSIERTPAAPLHRGREAMVACQDGVEIEMSTFKIQGLASALVATAVAAALAGLVVAPAQAQSHSHDATAPAKLSLNQGHKWATDDALRTGMAKIQKIVEPQLGAAHAGKLSPAQYAALAGQIESEVGGIVANCKLEPKADAVLHIIIGEISAGTDAMAGKTTQLRPAQGLVQVGKAVNDYAGHFDHPGFKPIRNIH